MKKKTVLILGIGQTNFLNPIYEAVKSNIDNVSLFIDRLRDINSSKTKLYNTEVRKKNHLFLRFLFFFKIFKLFYFKLLGLKLVDGSLGSTYLLLKRIISSNLEFFKYEAFDYYHFHFVALNNLLVIPYISPKQSTIILSFWGSDLLRVSDLANNYITTYACQKAATITIQSLELREILLAKIDRQLIDKVVVQTFIIDRKIINSIDNCPYENHMEAYDEGRINILVGHNANTKNQHVKIIESIKHLKNQERYNLIFVFGYGINNEEFKSYYKNHLISLLKDTYFAYKFVESYLAPEEIAFLRKYVQITIHTPVSDALSAAVTESMYAGNIVITGAWLPFGPLRRAGCKFYEVETFKALPEMIARYKEIKVQDAQSLKMNKDLIQENFLTERIAEKWVDLFQN